MPVGEKAMAYNTRTAVAEFSA